MTGEVRIETPRLVLRDWREGDLDRFAAITNTPAVMRWLGGVMDADGVVAQGARVARCRAAHGHCFWIVERRPDGGELGGEMLGFCGLKRIDAPGASFTGAFEIGWRLREDAWGQGYAREAAIASLDAGFGRFGAERIHAITIAENTASWGLMRRLGMRRREELDFTDPRLAPPFCDTIVYSLDAQEWTARS